MTRREWLLWFGLLGVATVVLLAMRQHVNQAHVALVYLLVVQGGSARGGRPLGVSLAGTAFVLFDLLFLPPYGRLTIQDPLNWLVLAAFLVTSVVAAQLLYRAQAEAAIARERADEVDRLAALGAETLNVGRAEDALTAIVDVIRSTLRLDACAVYLVDPTTGRARLASESPASETTGSGVQPASLEQWVAENGRPAAENAFGVKSTDLAVMRSDTGLAPSFRSIVSPLRVRERTVGVLRITRGGGLELSAAQVRVLDALSYYAALGAERVRLAAEAERATALQEAHRAKDAVLASVSHDLRTPLTTIKALAHEVAEQGDERAMVIEEEADRLNAFVAKLLDLSRVSSGAGATDVQPNEAEDLLGAAVQQCGGRLGGRELRVALDPEHPLLIGRFDFAQTLRALVNLVENAAKYSPAGAPIEIAVKRRGVWLCFSVSDRGPGVPASERERIFEPFYRRPGVASDVGGAGLGLSIARGIAQAQGGSLTLAEREGGGSVFTLSVPAVEIEDLSTIEG